MGAAKGEVKAILN